jgi:hypothetical protein
MQLVLNSIPQLTATCLRCGSNGAIKELELPDEACLHTRCNIQPPRGCCYTHTYEEAMREALQSNLLNGD